MNILTFHEDAVVKFPVTTLFSKRCGVLVKAACFREILMWPDERYLRIFILSSLF